MEQNGCTADEASGLLRQASQRSKCAGPRPGGQDRRKPGWAAQGRGRGQPGPVSPWRAGSAACCAWTVSGDRHGPGTACPHAGTAPGPVPCRALAVHLGTESSPPEPDLALHLPYHPPVLIWASRQCAIDGSALTPGTRLSISW